MFILSLRIHMGQMLASENFHPVIVKLKDQLFSRVYELTVSYSHFISNIQVSLHECFNIKPIISVCNFVLNPLYHLFLHFQNITYSSVSCKNVISRVHIDSLEMKKFPRGT